MKQNGFAVIIYVIIITFLAGSALSLFRFKKRNDKIQLKSPIAEILSPTPTIFTTPSPALVKKAKNVSKPVPTPTIKNRLGAPDNTSTSNLQNSGAANNQDSNNQVNSGTISIDKSSVNVTIDRSNVNSGLVYGEGFTITSQGATSWQIKYNQSTQGQGFYESSGGINPGGSANIRSYINASKPNGTYSGSAVIEYYKDNNWNAGPTVSYTIILNGSSSLNNN